MPASPSPPTSRAVDVLEFLCARPGHEHRLAEVVDALGISKATCHAILAALVERGWVLRSPVSLGYAPGPALLAAGQAAATVHPAVLPARVVVERLAAAHGAECVASVIDGEVITVVARAASDAPGAIGWSRLGQRIPFVPPFGAAQVAFADDVTTEGWLARAPEGTAVAGLRSQLAAIRRRGWDVQADAPGAATLRRALGEVDPAGLTNDGRRALERLLVELGAVEQLPERLRAATTYDVNAVAAAAFDAAAHPVLTISLHVDRAMSGREVDAVGGAVRAGADEITAAIGGTAG